MSAWATLLWAGTGGGGSVTPAPAPVVYPLNLTEIADQLTALLLQIMAAPQATYSVNGQSYTWAQYQRLLTRQIQQMRKLATPTNCGWN